MITLTVRHTKKDSLKSLITAMEKAYTNLQGSHAYKILRNEYNAKFVRVTEVTYGKNGFHPHFHIAVIHDKGVKFSSLSNELENTWIKHIEKNGLKAPKAGVAMDITENADNEQRAWYLTKASGTMSLEISNGRNKRAMGENMSIWQLHGHAVQGSVEALKVWGDYENQIKGKRLISPSRGLEAFFGVKWKGEAEAVTNEFDDIENSQMPIMPFERDEQSDTPDSDNLQYEHVELSGAEIEGITHSPIIPEFICAITPTQWKKILIKKKVKEFRACASYEGAVAFLEANGITGKPLSFDEIAVFHGLKQDLIQNMREALEKTDKSRFDSLNNCLKAGEQFENIVTTLKNL